MLLSSLQSFNFKLRTTEGGQKDVSSLEETTLKNLDSTFALGLNFRYLNLFPFMGHIQLCFNDLLCDK